MVLIGIKREEN